MEKVKINLFHHILRPVATFPRVGAATLPGIISQYHTVPGAGCMIVDGSKIRLLTKKKKKLLSNTVHNLAIKSRRNVESVFFPLLPAQEKIPGPKYRIMRH